MGQLSKNEVSAATQGPQARGEEKDVGAASPADVERIERDVGQVNTDLERRVRRKMDWHIIPLVSALYLLAFLDRSNIG